MQDRRAELAHLLHQFEAELNRSQAVTFSAMASLEKALLELQELIREAEQTAAGCRIDQTLLEIRWLLADW